MRINEIFYSIQGEGVLAGMPSVFIRTAGCNLRCGWCDTREAAWEGEGTEMSVDDIMSRVQSFPARYGVLTGGEPMLAAEIHELANRLHAAGKHITIETNATLVPADIHCDLASLSPKTGNSTPDRSAGEEWPERHDKARLRLEVIRQWIEQYAFQLKFVVSTPGDIEDITALLDDLGGYGPPERVLLMPEGTEVESLQSRERMLIDICKEKGYRYGRRLHIEVFGHRGGV